MAAPVLGPPSPGRRAKILRLRSSEVDLLPSSRAGLQHPSRQRRGPDSEKRWSIGAEKGPRGAPADDAENWPRIRGEWALPSTTSSRRASPRAATSCSGGSWSTSPARASSSTRAGGGHLELFEEKNVIINTPTGSGKSLVASALHFASLARDRRSVYTCPIKALVNEKWMALCRELGPENVGLATGDATVNRDAPVLCCTAEILANIALREGEDAWVDDVVMDEFHWYADRDRGVAWQVPLLTCPRPGSCSCPPRWATSRSSPRTSPGATDARPPVVKSVERPVRSSTPTSEIPLPQTAGEARGGGQGAGLRGPLHAAGRRGQRAELHQPEPRDARGEERGRRGDRGVPLHEPVRARRPQVAEAGDRPAPRGAAAEVPRPRRAARAAGPPQGHLRHGHARGRDQRADPDRASSRGCASSTARRRRSSPRATSTRSPAAPAGRASTTSVSWWPRPRST